MATSNKNCFEINTTILLILAPKTFLIPISLTRCEIEKADKPNKPRHATKIAIKEKTVNIVFCFCSDW